MGGGGGFVARLWGWEFCISGVVWCKLVARFGIQEEAEEHVTIYSSSRIAQH